MYLCTAAYYTNYHLGSGEDMATKINIEEYNGIILAK
jgi:hypothetical protein